LNRFLKGGFDARCEDPPTYVRQMQDILKLRVIAQARVVLRLAYRTTATFPVEERYVATSQMRRSAWGIGSNIAEGCGRSSYRALRVSLDRAMGEASELRLQCLGCQDLELGDQRLVNGLLAETNREMKMLANFIVDTRRRSYRAGRRDNEGMQRGELGS
jgi:four helix bundle protein